MDGTTTATVHKKEKELLHPQTERERERERERDGGRILRRFLCYAAQSSLL